MRAKQIAFAAADAKFGLSRFADKIWGFDAIFPPGEKRPVRVVTEVRGAIPRGITIVEGDLAVDVLDWRTNVEAVLVITGELRARAVIISGPANLWVGALAAELVATELTHAGSLIATACTAPVIAMLGDGEHVLPKKLASRIIQRDAKLLARRWKRAEPTSGALAAGIGNIGDVIAAVDAGRPVVRSAAEIGPTIHGRPIATLEALGSTRDTRALAGLPDGTVFPCVTKLHLPEHAMNAHAARMRWPVLEELDMAGPHTIPVGSNTPDMVAIPPHMFATMPELRRLRVTAFCAFPPALLEIPRLESLDFDQAIFNPVFYTKPDPGLRLADLAALRARYPGLRIAFADDVCFELPPEFGVAIAAAIEVAELLTADKLAPALKLVEKTLDTIAKAPDTYSHVNRYDLRALAIWGYAKHGNDARQCEHARLGVIELGPPSGWFISEKGLGACRQLAKLAGNALAWAWRETDPVAALPMAELARQGATLGRDDFVFDTYARVLLALGRNDEAYELVAQVDPKFAPVRDIVKSRGYRAFRARKEA